LGFGALGAPVTYSGEPAPKPTKFVIDPEKLYPVTVYTGVMRVADGDLTCRVSGVEGAFRVTPGRTARSTYPVGVGSTWGSMTRPRGRMRGPKSLCTGYGSSWLVGMMAN
jgi:hypothetical protein